MSQAQERRRAEAWETQHKASHEESIKKLQEMKKCLDKLDTASAEYTELKSQYDTAYAAAEDFFMRYYES